MLDRSSLPHKQIQMLAEVFHALRARCGKLRTRGAKLLYLPTLRIRDSGFKPALQPAHYHTVSRPTQIPTDFAMVRSDSRRCLDPQHTTGYAWKHGKSIA